MAELHHERLSALRAELARRGVAGFIVPRADEHQGEYLPPGAERLSWLTGFTGSAGFAAVLADRAALFTDGRYTLQIRAEADGADYDLRHQTEQPLAPWLIEALPAGGRIGYDPWLHTTAWVEKLRAELKRTAIALEPLESNPLDAVWPDRPPPPLAPATIQPLAYAGRSAAVKRAEIAALLRKAGVQVELSDDFERAIPQADAVYMTRIQDEWDKAGESSRIDTRRFCFTQEHLRLLGPEGVIMHPFPRRQEIDVAVDQDPRAVYWRQMRNGMWIRTALIASIFGKEPAIRGYVP